MEFNKDTCTLSQGEFDALPEYPATERELIRVGCTYKKPLVNRWIIAERVVWYFANVVAALPAMEPWCPEED